MRSLRRIALIGATVLTLAGVEVPAAGAGPLPGAPDCPVTPSSSYWHADVSGLPLDRTSDTYVASAGVSAPLHADFGAGLYAGGPIGIPFVTVGTAQAKVPIGFGYASESDPGPYPIPPNAPIEGGSQSSGDRHVLVVDRDHCVLYETFASYPHNSGATWTAGSGAIWDLRSNAFRHDTWTSADAAGLPILPGLVRYDEIAAGEIDHAIRITLNDTDDRYVWPARHGAGVNDPSRAPMGQRFRLKGTVDVARFGPQSQVVVRALKKYGAIVADNGSSWFISGAPDPRFDNDDLHALQSLHGSDFEAVDSASLVVDPNTGESTHTNPPPPPPPPAPRTHRLRRDRTQGTSITSGAP